MATEVWEALKLNLKFNYTLYKENSNYFLKIYYISLLIIIAIMIFQKVYKESNTDIQPLLFMQSLNIF